MSEARQSCGCWIDTPLGEEMILYCSVHAAAPDLLAALESAPEPKHTIEAVEEWFRWHQEIRAAALAKARGKA